MNALGASAPGLIPFGIATAVPLVLATAISCAHPGTEPHEMSVQGHEEAARQAAQESERLRSYPCQPGKDEGVNVVCWTPSEADEASASRSAAEVQRQLAEAHRNAAAALRAEADAACAGVRVADRTMSPFFHVADLDGAHPLRTTASSKSSLPSTLGVTIFVRPVPGLTEQWLQRLVLPSGPKRSARARLRRRT